MNIDPTITAELRQEVYERGLAKHYERVIIYAPDMTLPAEANLLRSESFAQELYDSYPQHMMRLAVYASSRSLLPANYETDQMILDEAMVCEVLDSWLEDERKRLISEWMGEQL